MTFLSPLQISIHALREEGDSPAFCGEGSALVFLSTPSARRATPASRCTFHPTAHFYPRPPRGGRRTSSARQQGTMQFLSTPSARRATRQIFHRAVGELISIHALREEGDGVAIVVAQAVDVFLSTPSARRATLMVIRVPPRYSDFYPRPPRGGRPPLLR